MKSSSIRIEDLHENQNITNLLVFNSGFPSLNGNYVYWKSD